MWIELKIDFSSQYLRHKVHKAGPTAVFSDEVPPPATG